ncbi:adenylyl-sulfate reductase [Sulfuricella sp.]|uniref:adenylyl-sulfate reductase n=1 Tax=Sulfuricella sp. TaxID=2099377 RepID=UPI002C8CF772|nr:adenylyl-sulfate reductase [Sulfuricella sp.]HUX64665.1 adenylyl-sulfate reductase [Sulfuricella sp.]
MFTTNPFTPLTAFVSPAVMQGYIILMIIAVAIGTAFDLLHGKKAKFFLQERKRAKAAAKQQLSTVGMAAIATRTLVNDIATFGEFCNRYRRISHVLMFYGFVLYLITTIVLVFVYPTDTRTPVIFPILWNIGVLMTLVGGYWFFFFLRVNVVHDGHSPWRLVRADLFIVTLLASVTFALLLEVVEMAENTAATKVFAGIYLFFTTLLFVSVPWSKFAHMFYKPVVAFQRRVEEADGSSDLPTPTTAGGERCPHSHT